MQYVAMTPLGMTDRQSYTTSGRMLKKVHISQRNDMNQSVSQSHLLCVIDLPEEKKKEKKVIKRATPMPDRTWTDRLTVKKHIKS